jgi:hypothetical protein
LLVAGFDPGTFSLWCTRGSQFQWLEPGDNLSNRWISAYTRKGFIDSQTLSFDAYLKFLEDIFLCGQRLDPATDG